METILDFNPTDLELKRFGGRKRIEEELKVLKNYSNDTNCYMIGMLFSMRGDKKRANYYWSKIKTREMLGTLVQDF